VGLGSVDSNGVAGDIIGRGNLGWEASGRGADSEVCWYGDTGKNSMDFYYCQGLLIVCISFERETGKWIGLRWLAGICEFGETVK
jgi:hypothetical protein